MDRFIQFLLVVSLICLMGVIVLQSDSALGRLMWATIEKFA